jgi:transposase InsO family protein
MVGWEVHERECAEYAAGVVRRAVLAEGCLDKPLVLHADHGSPQKGSALRATLEALGVLPSSSRPRVSDDNAFSEAVFRTCSSPMGASRASRQPAPGCSSLCVGITTSTATAASAT